MAEDRLSKQIGRQILLPGHFDVPVVLQDVRAVGRNGSAGYGCRVCLPDGTLKEAVISPAEAATLFGMDLEAPPAIKPADAERLRPLMESARIRPATPMTGSSP